MDGVEAELGSVYGIVVSVRARKKRRTAFKTKFTEIGAQRTQKKERAREPPLCFCAAFDSL
jgi:hypothetical protein